jgi:hypothetical protein
MMVFGEPAFYVSINALNDSLEAEITCVMPNGELFKIAVFSHDMESLAAEIRSTLAKKMEELQKQGWERPN